MIYRVAVCDDEEHMAKLVCRAVDAAFRKTGNVALTDCFTSPAMLLRNMEVFKYDAVCLDIDMPGMDGVETARKLHEIDEYIGILFISNMDDRIFDAQCVDPVRFVRKRFLDTELPMAVAAMIRRRSKSDVPKLHVTVGDSEKYLKIHEILYVESFNNKQTIVLESGKLNVYQSMGFFEEKLLPHGFLRPHRCYIVNCRYVYSFERQSLLLENGAQLPVSRLRVEECKREFMKFVEENDG